MRRSRQKRLDLQAKIVLLLVAVIVPTFVVVTVAENKFTRPILEDELRQMGITSGKTIAAEILGSRWLQRQNPTPAIESYIQEVIYSQPHIVRIDVIAKDPASSGVKVVGSSVEDEPGAPLPSWAQSVVENVVSEHVTDESGTGLWEIRVPIEQKSRDPKGPRKILGTVHLVVSLKLIGRITGALWRTTVTAAVFSVVTLVFLLGYFLRKTIANDRLLRQAENQNLVLAEQLHAAQRQLMTNEKLAVMGQLTASFAHEIGTPLNAIGGHLQLLREDLAHLPAPAAAPAAPAAPSGSGGVVGERLEIINGQVAKIEEIVKGFLQSTAKPSSQRQLVDFNLLVEKTLGLVKPRLEAMSVEVKRFLERQMGPLRVVPLDIEQILLNLVNNSLDSLQSKAQTSGGRERARLLLEISTTLDSIQGKDWAVITVYDTGEGIRKTDMDQVLKPFFTTKRPGEGTGLGLTICQQLVHKYGGNLELDSKEGSWTRVIVRVPYQNHEHA